MLIRSQDKKDLVNLDNITEIYAHRNMLKDRTMILPEYETKIICFTGRNEIPIGIYSSEEKAIKVLDMIEKAYLDFTCNYHNESGLFQMPQDDEELIFKRGK